MARAKKAAGSKGASSSKGATTRRGSPEAIAKRRVARALNRLFEEGGTATTIDGRTLKRKKRLIKELTEGRGNKPLKALDVLGHATELLQLGETLTTIRQMKPRLPPPPDKSPESLAVYAEAQKNYGFDPKAWKLLGIDIASLSGDKPAPKPAAKRASRKKR